MTSVKDGNEQHCASDFLGSIVRAKLSSLGVGEHAIISPVKLSSKRGNLKESFQFDKPGRCVITGVLSLKRLFSARVRVFRQPNSIPSLAEGWLDGGRTSMMNSFLGTYPCRSAYVVLT